jgi:hypothetical protein
MFLTNQLSRQNLILCIAKSETAGFVLLTTMEVELSLMKMWNTVPSPVDTEPSKYTLNGFIMMVYKPVH